MSFKHKRSHFIALLVAVGILAVMACDLPLRPPGTTVDQLVISPKAVDAQPNQDVALMAVALTTQGDTAQISVTWAASDGTIGNYSDNGGRHYAHYGNASSGTFKVWATSNPGGKSDTATITVTRANGSAGTVQVTCTVASNTAQSGADFTPTGPVTLTFNDGEIQKTLRVAVLDDELAEGSETIELTLGPPTAVAVLGGSRRATLFIPDDDIR